MDPNLTVQERLDIDDAVHEGRMKSDPAYREQVKRFLEVVYQTVGEWSYR